MDIMFQDSQADLLPPESVRILKLKVDPFPDGKRVRLMVELTPFQKKPSGDIFITNQENEIVTSASFIEAITSKFDMTLHLRSHQPGLYIAKLTLFYISEIEDQDRNGELFIQPEKKVVDEMKEDFRLITDL